MGDDVPEVEEVADADENMPARKSSGRDASDKGGDTTDHRLASFQDTHGVAGHVEWTAFDHPTLGEVEIGGFSAVEALNPPAKLLGDLIASHSEFVDYLSTLFADVSIAKTEVTAHGGGIFTVTVEVENSGFLPTATAHGVASRSVKPTMVQIGIAPEDLVSGAAKTSFFQALDGSGSQQKFEWIIKGSNGDKVEIKVVSQKGGSDTMEVTLR